MKLQKTQVVLSKAYKKIGVNSIAKFKDNLLGYVISEEFNNHYNIQIPKIGRSVENINTVDFQNMYFLSDEEVVEGDYVYNETFEVGVLKIVHNTLCYYAAPRHEVDGSFTTPIRNIKFKKIIASTDTSLNLPKPTVYFVKEYVKKYNEEKEIEYVNVEYTHQYYSSKKFYAVEATWIDCDETVFNSIRNAIPNCPARFIPKVNELNEISIKDNKESWNREEVVKLLKIYGKDIIENGEFTELGFEEWLNKNL